MSTSVDYYEILGIARDASGDEPDEVAPRRRRPSPSDEDDDEDAYQRVYPSQRDAPEPMVPRTPDAPAEPAYPSEPSPILPE